MLLHTRSGRAFPEYSALASQVDLGLGKHGSSRVAAVPAPRPAPSSHPSGRAVLAARVVSGPRLREDPP